MGVEVRCPGRANEEREEGGPLKEPIALCQGCPNISYCKDGIIVAELAKGFSMDELPQDYHQYIKIKLAGQRAEFITYLELIKALQGFNQRFSMPDESIKFLDRVIDGYKKEK